MNPDLLHQAKFAAARRKLREEIKMEPTQWVQRQYVPFRWGRFLSAMFIAFIGSWVAWAMFEEFFK